MELKDTVEMMNSSDYEEQFKAEYWQIKIRYEKLLDTIDKIKAKTVDLQYKSSQQLLETQASFMARYLHMLEIRADVEDIKLNREVGI